MSGQTHERPDMLVETDWLEKYMDDPQLRIVDMGPIDGFKRCHIPGAIGLDRDYLKDPDNDLFVMQPEQFEEAMGKVGIGNEHNVVAYDDYGGLYAARLWWALRTFGHDKVWVLNGGWNKWMREGRAWTQIAVTGYHSRDFNPHPPAKFKAQAELLDALLGRYDHGEAERPGFRDAGCAVGWRVRRYQPSGARTAVEGTCPKRYTSSGRRRSPATICEPSARRTS